MYFVDERTKQNEEPESLRFPAHRRGAIGFEVGRTASNSNTPQNGETIAKSQ